MCLQIGGFRVGASSLGGLTPGYRPLVLMSPGFDPGQDCSGPAEPPRRRDAGALKGAVGGGEEVLAGLA